MWYLDLFICTYRWYRSIVVGKVPWQLVLGALGLPKKKLGFSCYDNAPCGFVWKYGIFPMKLPFKNGIMISKTIGFRGTQHFQTFSDTPMSMNFPQLKVPKIDQPKSPSTAVVFVSDGPLRCVDSADAGGGWPRCPTSAVAAWPEKKKDTKGWRFSVTVDLK